MLVVSNKVTISTPQVHFRHSLNSGAFTLIELLVAIAIIAIIATLGFAGTKAAMEQARKSREISAAKSLVAAYLIYPEENNGMLMVAHYEGSTADLDSSVYKLPNGDQVDSASLHRYPFRLAPYMDHQLEGTVLVNNNKEQISRAFSGSRYNYGISLCPALGINHYFVGGYKVDGKIANSGDTITHMGQASSPVLVFASAYTEVEGERIDGHYGVTPPKYRTTLWEDDTSPDLDFRYGNKAICAFLDGSVRLHSAEELQDMRLWSVKAATSDNANYNVPAQGSGGLGGGGGGRR